MRVALVALLALCSVSADAQTMFKCTDAQRRITYSNEACDKQGLRDAGKIADRVTTMPFTAPQKPAARKETDTAPASGDDVETVQRGARIKPVVPLLEKLAK